MLGASVRYNYGWFDVFGEVATAQNINEQSQSAITNRNTNPIGASGTIIGSRFYPPMGVSLIALYRYYSPYFDNALGYAFSETSRICDENGGYLGFEITRWRNWRLFGYGDVFYFSGYKYGLGDATQTLGYDAMAELQYHSNPPFMTQSPMAAFSPSARQKGDATYSSPRTFDWSRGGWSLRTTADANLHFKNQQSPITNSITYGFTSLRKI